MLGSSDWAMLLDAVCKSVRQYTSKLLPWAENREPLIAGQFNGKMPFVGLGNADEVLVDVDFDVGLVEVVDVDADADAVADKALVTAASPPLLPPVVALELLVPSLATRAPTAPPTIAPMMTSRTTAAMRSAVRFGRPHQRRG